MRASTIIASIILISLSGCYTTRKMSIQSFDIKDSLEVQDPNNHIPVEGKGRLHSYAILSDSSENIIPGTHRVSSSFISQDSLRLILSPKGNHPERLRMHYDIPVSNVESVTFRKFSVWRTCLIPVGLVGLPLAALAIMMEIGWHD